ncbi:hypothetical protein COL516b_006583 [Colletotrichum fioriniae]|nr:uncharacterized protein COL516b_006583 [Colletotrichum fioriniae]KAJ0303578.1 hypothetical protein COL516b_006583 [Colletotrichum fioriniae]
MTWNTGSWGPEGFGKAHDLPPMEFRDGPPWSEDEDLASPVVSSRHRKHKSSAAALGGTAGLRNSRDASNDMLHPAHYEQRERGYYVGTSGDGSERYYLNQGGEANGPGGEYVTYPPGDARHSSHAYQLGFRGDDQSRYSRDYQFTITSPDEEMHGKAVALFDFERENENELPLLEGQIIWVSYRHGQGWLVAEDPKTQESGLVPEEYVRLLRDIEGGMNSLTGNLGEGSTSPNDVGTPTQAEHHPQGHTPTGSQSSSNGYHQPVVSTFSTSSKDLDPYPTQQLGLQSGQPPPQVVHYHGQRGGSQANTPTLASHQDIGMMRRGSQDTGAKKTDSQVSPLTEAITESKLVDRSSTPKATNPTEKPADPEAMDTER